MKRRVFIKNSIGSIILLKSGTIFSSCSNKEYYTINDFEKAPKSDAHFHYNVFDDAILKYADSINMHLLSINVDAGKLSVKKQLEIASSLKKTHPDKMDFLGSFTVDEYGSDSFAEGIIRQIDNSMNAGAKGIKIWKNVGMVLQDEKGKYIMADDPVFDPVFAYLEKNGIPMTAHLGEPRNCWLPYEEITMGGDLSYYKEHPQYHMYQHPEAPTYDEQIIARDHILDKYPQLKLVGAHIGSLEWNLDEIAHRFNKYPELLIDLSARIGHVQLQAIANKDKVRDFFIKYQDRILYGSDVTLDERRAKNTDQMCKSLYETWKNQWLFLATNEVIPADKFNIPNAPETIEGLQLPKVVVDKIFFENTNRIFII